MSGDIYESITKVEVSHPHGAELNYITYFPSNFRNLWSFLNDLWQMLVELNYKKVREEATYSATTITQIGEVYVNDAHLVRVVIHYQRIKDNLTYLVNVNVRSRDPWSNELDTKLVGKLDNMFKTVNISREFY